MRKGKGKGQAVLTRPALALSFLFSGGSVDDFRCFYIVLKVFYFITFVGREGYYGNAMFVVEEAVEYKVRRLVVKSFPETRDVHSYFCTIVSICFTTMRT
jgi:hypothetical protein